MRTGERQVAPTIAGIRRDHVARYAWAALRIGGPCLVVDFACGIGYGAWLLAVAGHQVLAIDRSADALDYGRRHYAHPGITWLQADAGDPPPLPAAAVAVCFETIEHLDDPAPLLRALGQAAPRLLASVPNEDVFPFRGQPFHRRHYRADELQDLLTVAGFQIVDFAGQAGPLSGVVTGCRGRTIVVDAVREGRPYEDQDRQRRNAEHDQGRGRRYWGGIARRSRDQLVDRRRPTRRRGA